MIILLVLQDVNAAAARFHADQNKCYSACGDNHCDRELIYACYVRSAACFPTLDVLKIVQYFRPKSCLTLEQP